jgi:hypothetical protein
VTAVVKVTEVLVVVPDEVLTTGVDEEEEEEEEEVELDDVDCCCFTFRGVVGCFTEVEEEEVVVDDKVVVGIDFKTVGVRLLPPLLLVLILLFFLSFLL